ncbi:MAG TPA: hypothetical protein ENN38_02750 [Actinobacteria bacterium]|nr:hypothetical protein [Actinomycetota bacterium]
MAKDVTIEHTIGDVFLIRNGKKREITAVPFKKPVKLKDSDIIITGAKSYVSGLWDEPGTNKTGTGITIFPNSELVLGIKGIIRKIELIEGLFRIVTEKEAITPTTELRFPQGNTAFWIDVSKDGSTVVASESVPMEVVHKRTKKGVLIGFKQQVTVTNDDILEPCGLDQRFKEAYKVWESLEQSKAKFLYGDMLERNVPQELQKFAKVVEEKTGRKEDYNPAKYQKWLKEQKEFGEWKYDEAVESKLPEFKPQKLEEKITSKPTHKIIVLNKSVNYQGINFKITSFEKGQEFKGRNAPEGKEFLVLNVDAKNNSTKQVFVFYDEEVRLINESSEVISLENYKLETSFEFQTENRGFLLFLVDKENKKFKLQFGKKSLPKVELELNLNKK